MAQLRVPEKFSTDVTLRDKTTRSPSMSEKLPLATDSTGDASRMLHKQLLHFNVALIGQVSDRSTFGVVTNKLWRELL